ncbi:hypothetical protein A0H81_04953 [Grifola frondosa]|uniref:Uncharacterized protein n=1 Tax=Grifola frondosa TaxID=5627 RepID=A0A1C7MGR0_GRIFR|nr:hypothetical protein A0H81_04953 [Grifola frondosa]
MELTFSQSSPNTTVLSDSQGLPRYRVCSSLEWKQAPTTTIYRVTLHGDATPPYDDRDEEWLEELVKIYWHLMGSARIIYNRQLVNISQLVHTEGLFGRRASASLPHLSAI